MVVAEEQAPPPHNNNNHKQQHDASDPLVKTTVIQHISTTPTSVSGASEPTPLDTRRMRKPSETSPVPHIVGSHPSKVQLSIHGSPETAVNEHMLYADRDQLPFIVRGASVTGVTVQSFGTAYPRIPSHQLSISNLVIDDILKKPKMNRLSVTHTLPAQKSLAVHVLETATTADRSSNGGSSEDGDTSEDADTDDGTESSSSTSNEDDEEEDDSDGDAETDGDTDDEDDDEEEDDTQSKMSKKSSRMADVLSLSKQLSTASKLSKTKQAKRRKHIKVTVIEEEQSMDTELQSQQTEVKENVSEELKPAQRVESESEPKGAKHPHRTTNTLSSIRDRIALVQKNMAHIRSKNGSSGSVSMSQSHPVQDLDPDIDLYVGKESTVTKDTSSTDIEQNVQLTKLKLGHADSLERVKQNMARIKGNYDEAKSK
eukprot:CAMPEP_0202716354 /NCGR_PEP_ID=MMETSP1385-20130828/100643_1 /ASSEMBLY_ACC=CAM_ASM_000861 /TAXON_ID=933848 /ORGANISM="Elphidium margaritaceum" /LENGTH=427 /DNA_ID=CAMNT_0049378071 /DNA_START=196 /DNA_END=1479 /DNA_ORIENTATION=+